MSIKVKQIGLMVFFILCIAFTACANAISSYATDYPEMTENVFTYKERKEQKYTINALYPGWTGVTYLNADSTLKNSYKYTSYAEYEDSNGSDIKYRYRTADGTDDVIVTQAYSSVYKDCTTRYHYAEIRYTSKKTSKLIEGWKYRIKKIAK